MEIGRILDGRWELLRPLAEGASSTVWEARDARTEARVAVKAVSMEQAGWRAEVRDRFAQEARLLALVDNPHLASVRAFGETDDGYLYLVLDLLEGETLADRLARPPKLSAREAAAVALELADGLAALHERGIVHRDLKPANVILHDAGDGAPPTPKIIDLGISKAGAAAADPVLFATLTATGQVLGTPEYMSYEQAIGERGVDARADVWALGVVLHEMLTGRRPFSGNNPNAVLAAIRRGPAPSCRATAPSVPPALAAVVDRCLERPREARYANGRELGDALTEALAQTRPETSRTRLVAGGALASAAAVLGAAWALGAFAPRHVEAPSSSAPSVAAVTASAAAPSATAIPAPAATSAAASPPPPSSAAASSSAAPPPASARPGRPGGAVTKVNSAGF